MTAYYAAEQQASQSDTRRPEKILPGQVVGYFFSGGSGTSQPLTQQRPGCLEGR